MSSFNLIELIQAKFTLIAIDTPDYYIADQILTSILEPSGLKVQHFKNTKEDGVEKGAVLWTLNMEPSKETLSKLSVNQRTLLILNYTGENPSVFRAGRLETPHKMIEDTLLLKYEPQQRPVIHTAIDGLSYIESKQLIRLAGVRGTPITVKDLKKLRSELYGIGEGITPINTDSGFYVVNEDMAEWYEEIRPFLFSDDKALAPRGVLLDGPGGTGKTSFAKHLSRSENVPLYHLDIGSSMSRWQGESEANIRNHLNFVEMNAPCVLLIDEVEKALHTSNNEESSTRILAYLLWWLAEHSSKVFTVMTTNNKDALPPELYRPGRIDEVFTLKPISNIETQCFIVDSWFEDWGNQYSLDSMHVKQLQQQAVDALPETPKTPAEVINHCKPFARSFYISHLAKKKGGC